MSRGDWAVSPPASGTLNSRASPSRPFVKRSTHFCGSVPGKRERKKNCEGLTSHGGDVAQAAGETATAYDFRRMPLPAEVNAFQSKVGCHQDFVPGRRLQNRTVIADPGYHSALPRSCGPAKGGDQRFLREGHGNHSISVFGLIYLLCEACAVGTGLGKWGQVSQRKRLFINARGHADQPARPEGQFGLPGQSN